MECALPLHLFLRLQIIAGGLGTAPVYPQVKWLHNHGVDCDVIMGSKTKDLLMVHGHNGGYPQLFGELADEFHHNHRPDGDTQIIVFPLIRKQTYKTEEGRAMLKLVEGDTVESVAAVVCSDIEVCGYFFHLLHID